MVTTTSANWHGQEGLWPLMWQQILLSITALLIAMAIGLTLALWLGHLGRAGFLAVNVTNVGRAVPTFALLAVLVIPLPSALLDVSRGHAALPRNLAARVMNAMRETGPTWRAVSPKAGGVRLTTREWEVLELLEQGLTTQEIAERLTLTSGAVRSHISGALRKIGATDRAEAVRFLRGEIAQSA